MSLQGKGKALAVFAIIMAVFIIIIFSPEDRKKEIDTQDNSKEAAVSDNAPGDDLEYMKKFAWYAEEDKKRYWFFLSEKETADGKEECCAITYTENMDVSLDIHDLSTRFTDELYYGHVAADGKKLSMRRQDGKFIESAYKINEKQNTLSMYSVTEDNGKAMLYHAADFDTLIYPTY